MSVNDDRLAVLVAEDDEDLRLFVADQLSKAGYSVTHVENGTAALDELVKSAFDVLVTDLDMPGMGGATLLATTRTTAPELETVVMTADANLETALACFRDGAFDVILKPFRIADLLTSVSRAAERRRLRAMTELYAASQVIFSARDRERLPETIVEIAMSALRSDAVSLMLPDERGLLYVAHAVGLSTEGFEERVPLGERIAGRVAVDRTPVVLTDSPGAAGRSSIIYPLLSAGRLLGILNLSRRAPRHAFRHVDLERVAIFCSQVVLALENAHLIRRLVATERLATVGQVSAGITHEINNPTAFVLTGAQFVHEGLLRLQDVGKAIESGATPEQALAAWEEFGGKDALAELIESANDVEGGACRIRDIVKDMRAMSMGDDSQVAVFDLEDAIRAALRVATHEARHFAKVETVFAADLKVLGHVGRLSQVVANLVINAAHAVGERKDGPRSICLRLSGEADKVFLEVEDTGAGIRPENLRRIFEPFFTTKPKGGIGLGLSLSRKIVRSHGGDILVRTRLGEGSCFTVVLPRAVPDEAPAPGPLGETEVKRKTRQVLVIDDEPAITRLYQRTIRKLCDVTVSCDGADGLRVLQTRSNDFDLVICDLLMPGVSGMELFRRISKDRPEMAAKFLFVTGSAQNPDVRAFLAERPGQLVEKPFESTTFVEIVRARLEKAGAAS